MAHSGRAIENALCFVMILFKSRASVVLSRTPLDVIKGLFKGGTRKADGTLTRHCSGQLSKKCKIRNDLMKSTKNNDELVSISISFRLARLKVTSYFRIRSSVRLRSSSS